MKIAIRYYTQTGNAKKLADAIAEELSLEAQDVTVALSEKTDIVFLCNSVHFAGADSSVKMFIKANKDKIGTLVNVSSAAIIASTYAQVKKVAEKEGVSISDKEFHCRGSFKMIHAGHPNEADLKAAREFAREIVSG